MRPDRGLSAWPAVESESIRGRFARRIRNAERFPARRRHQFGDPDVFLRQTRVQIFENCGQKAAVVDRLDQRRRNAVERGRLLSHLVQLRFHAAASRRTFSCSRSVAFRSTCAPRA